MKNAISAKHLKINAKALKREQLKYVSGCGVPITMLMCPTSGGEAPNLISFQNCDDAGHLLDGSGIYCKRGDAMYVQTC